MSIEEKIYVFESALVLMEAELAALKAQVEAEKNPPQPEMITVFDGWKPESDDSYFYPVVGDSTGTGRDTYVPGAFTEARRVARCTAFKTHEQAAAVADAIFVMLELRNQPGAGTYDRSEDGWVAQLDGKELDTDFWNKYKAQAMLCPPFGSEEQLTAALDAVGRDRVERALRVWGMMPIEVQS